MNPIVHNLDEERTKETIILGGKELDISFIPSGISIPILQKYQKYIDMLKEFKLYTEDGQVSKDAEKNLIDRPDVTLQTYNMMLEILAMFTEYKDPEMTIEWIGRNTDMDMIEEAFSILTQSIVKDINKRKDKRASKKKLNGNE